MLDESYILEAERRARRFAGAYTGTSGTLAADVLRLLKERREFMTTLEEARHAASPLAGCQPAQACAAEVLTRAWNAEPCPDSTTRLTLVGIAGRINSGKSVAASMIPGAYHVQWADPIYRGLAAMLDVPEELLRDRTHKDGWLQLGNGGQVMPRTFLQTLGTDWGRNLVHPDLWVNLTMARIDRLATLTGRAVFAICGTRFPNEVAAIRDRGGEVWWIERPGVAAGGHASERQIDAGDCDRTIHNDSSLDELRSRVSAAFSALA